MKTISLVFCDTSWYKKASKTNSEKSTTCHKKKSKTYIHSFRFLRLNLLNEKVVQYMEKASDGFSQGHHTGTARRCYDEITKQSTPSQQQIRIAMVRPVFWALTIAMMPDSMQTSMAYSIAHHFQKARALTTSHTHSLLTLLQAFDWTKWGSSLSETSPLLVGDFTDEAISMQPMLLIAPLVKDKKLDSA